MQGASNSIHALCQINSIVTLPTCDVLLRHFRKMSFTVGIHGFILLSIIFSCYVLYYRTFMFVYIKMRLHIYFAYNIIFTLIANTNDDCVIDRLSISLYVAICLQACIYYV